MLTCCETDDAMSNVERLQALIAMETMLDHELDELEYQNYIDRLKLEWLHVIGHQDLCHIIYKNMDKNESLARMYRPMLEDAYHEKMALVRRIRGDNQGMGDEHHDLEGAGNGDDDLGMEEDRDVGYNGYLATDPMASLGDDDDECGFRYT